MKNYKSIIYLLVLFMVMSFLSPALAITSLPQVSAPGAVVIDVDTNQILYDKNMNIPRSVASMTKVMTALLVYDAIDAGELTMDTKIPVSANAKSIIPTDPCGQYVPYPDEATVFDLLSVYLIVSSSPAGTAFAEYLGGDVPTFVNMMNEKANELGMDAIYTDPNGLLPNEVTPLAHGKLLRHFIVTYPEVLDITSQPSVNFNGRYFPGTNKFYSTYSDFTGVDGFKTGTMPFAGFCLSTSCHRDGRHLIGVVTGASGNPQRYGDMMNILNYGFARAAELETVVMKDDIIEGESVKTEPLVHVEEVKQKSEELEEKTIKPKEEAYKTSEWAVDMVKQAKLLGLDTTERLGYDDYQGQEPITRGEFAALVTLGLEPNQKESMTSFPDVTQDHPFYDEIMEAASCGIVFGYQDQTFRPDAPIQRQEMAVMITRAIKWPDRTPRNEFLDGEEVSYHFSEAIGRMYESKIMKGDENGYFNPLDTTTREMALASILNARETLENRKYQLRSFIN